MKTFATLFPRLERVAFNKGVGRIAYHFAEDLGWRSILAYCEIEDSPPPDWYLRKVEVQRLGKVDLTNRRTQIALMAEFLADRAREIDVLNLYDMRPESFFLGRLFKLLNPKGVVFIKADMDERAVDSFLSDSTVIRIYGQLLKRSQVDFVTVETSKVFNEVRPFFDYASTRLDLLPIGFDPPLEPLESYFRKKEKMILSVGRTGSAQKNNELLLESLLRIDSRALTGWRVVFVGNDELGFRGRAKELLMSRPDVWRILEFKDHVWDRTKLFDLYASASIFVLTSRWESFGTVLAEVPYFGGYPVITNVGAALDIVADERFGRVVSAEDPVAFGEALEFAISLDDSERFRAGRLLHEHIKAHFTWSAVVEALENLVKSSRNGKEALESQLF